MTGGSPQPDNPLVVQWEYRAHLAESVPPDLEFPFRTRSAHVVFVADKGV